MIYMIIRKPRSCGVCVTMDYLLRSYKVLLILFKMFLHENYNLDHFNLKLLATTLTELSAIAAPAVMGSSR
jgi:hypothetical protein